MTGTSEKLKKERTSITMHPDLLEKVRKFSIRQDQSASQFISSAVKFYLESLEQNEQG